MNDYDRGHEDGYGKGYAEGKDKAYFEVLHHDPAMHHEICGCRPCQVWNHVGQELVTTLQEDGLVYAEIEVVPGTPEDRRN